MNSFNLMLPKRFAQVTALAAVSIAFDPVSLQDDNIAKDIRRKGAQRRHIGEFFQAPNNRTSNCSDSDILIVTHGILRSVNT